MHCRSDQCQRKAFHCLSCSAPFKAAAAQIAQPSAFTSQNLATAPRSMPLLCPALCCHSMFSPCRAGLAVQNNALAIQCIALLCRCGSKPCPCVSASIRATAMYISSVSISAPAFLSYASCAHASRATALLFRILADPSHQCPCSAYLSDLRYALADLVAPCYAFAKHLRSILADAARVISMPILHDAFLFHSASWPFTAFPWLILSTPCIAKADRFQSLPCLCFDKPSIANPPQVVDPPRDPCLSFA